MKKCIHCNTYQTKDVCDECSSSGKGYDFSNLYTVDFREVERRRQKHYKLSALIYLFLALILWVSLFEILVVLRVQ